MLALEHSSDGRIVTVILNRPERRNALNLTLVNELTSVLRSLYLEDRLRVIVITGSGDVFSAGADLHALEGMQSASYEDNEADSEALATLFTTMIQGPKLLVAKVNGHAIAGGSGLVAACDIGIASSAAKFGFTEVRLGFVPALVSVLLRYRIPEAQLRDILLGGRLFSASHAQSLGLIIEHVASDTLDSVVDDYVTNICRNTSSAAIAQTKSLLYSNWGKDFDSSMQAAVLANARARSTDDCKKGVRSFLEKKNPPWVSAYDNDHPDRA